eukprot:2904922-Rhodomonas_salina.3
MINPDQPSTQPSEAVAHRRPRPRDNPMPRHHDHGRGQRECAARGGLGARTVSLSISQTTTL